MKLLAIVFNFLMIAVVVFFIATQGFPKPNKGDDFWLMLLWIICPSINLLVIFSNTHGGDNFFSLFMKRKALEEKSKIEQLSKKNN